MKSRSFLLFISAFLFSISSGITDYVDGRSFILSNQCSFTVWPGMLTNGGGAPIAKGGFGLDPGATRTVTAPTGWSGRIWPRTGCCFDASGVGQCVTGNCGGGLHCVGGGEPPATLAELALDGYAGKDFYDVSLVDGYNVGVGIQPVDNMSGDCRYAGCKTDLNAICPPELRVAGPCGGDVVACKSACAAFNTDEYCCAGAHSSPGTCAPTNYSKIFKSACPSAYSYAYDDLTSTFTCSGADYVITFCPSS